MLNNEKTKKRVLICHSGGSDSMAIMLDYIEKYGTENIISLGFQYGQRHFKLENAAATRFCEKRRIKRVVLDVPISQIGGCSLIDHSINVTTDMKEQRSTFVPQRNAIFLMYAAAYAEVNNCDTIVHGACQEDFTSYRDCRDIFFKLIEQTIQAGRKQPIKGSEDIKDDMDQWGCLYSNKIDIEIKTPLIYEKKEDTLKRIVKKYGVGVYEDSYTCYNGTEPSCGKCPACQERLEAFKINGIKDPLKYEI